MSTLDKFHTLLWQGETTPDEALELFDELNAVNLDFMMGRWKGSGFKTHHRMDGLLETIGWYGKEFISPDCVHPLLFSDGNKIFKVDPNPTAVNLGFSLDLPQKEVLKPLYGAMSKLLKTEESKARVRMTEYRGKLSATMIYDYLPINDVFRKIDDSTLLGLMDFKGMEQPFFFVLNRD
ncbi:MAG: DUF4334 domain-containing protein [Cyanobacteria bacterium P01_D01_bin.36]